MSSTEEESEESHAGNINIKNLNRNIENIRKHNQILLSGSCQPTENNKNDTFSYTISEAMKKNTVEMVYQHKEDGISPFDILSEFPNGDFQIHSNKTWKGVLNICVTIPARSQIHYPTEFNFNESITVMVDLMKCTQKQFKKKIFISHHPTIHLKMADWFYQENYATLLVFRVIL